jgi:hypothetical protein
VHLTKLAADGTGKAGTDKDKIMLGPSNGQPIVVADNPEHGELLIAEGIEDALSLALVTGWTAWAAGSASRIASVLPAATAFERIYIAVDDDAAGTHALARGRPVCREVIPLRIAKALGRRDRLDANKCLIAFGADALILAIEWAEAQDALARKRVGFHVLRC